MAKAFQLASVLALREQAEAAAERALIDARARAKAARAALAGLQERMGAHATQRSAEIDRVLPAAHHQAAADQWRALCAEQAALSQQMQLLDERATECQRWFLSARRDREMLTELHEKYENALHATQQRDEHKRLDDLFNARRARRH